MPIEIVVPQIGEAVAELTLTTWLKAEGDAVTTGEVLFEIDSDKAIVEVEAFVDGTLVEIIAPEGSSVLPQQVVARLLPVGEIAEPAIEAASTNDQPVKIDAANNQKISPVARRLAADLGVNLTAISGSGPGGRVTVDDVRQSANHREMQPARINASPKARRLARELQLDLNSLTGTGVDGMIRVNDVEAMQAEPQVQSTTATASAMLPLTKSRQTIAERTIQSKQTVPHFYLLADVNMSQVNQLRTYCRETLRWEKAPTYTDVLVRACSLALRDLPEMNRHYTAAGLVAHDTVNIGVAIHTDGGLVAPVIAHTDQLDLQGTAGSLRELASRARAGRLKAADTGPKSLVISNLGMYSVDAFIAIIDMPDPMILAVGQVADRVVAVNGQAVVQPMCTLTLSVDHRTLDGVPAAQFLERIKVRLENPFEILNLTHTTQENFLC